MALQSQQNGPPYTSDEIQQKFERLLQDLPGLPRHSPRFAVLMDEADGRAKVVNVFKLNVTDMWLPVNLSLFPTDLGPGLVSRFRKKQSRFLSDGLEVAPDGRYRFKHFHLGDEQIDRHHHNLPKGFRLDRLLGDGGFGSVYAVHHITNKKEVYALKRIRREKDWKLEIEKMRYVDMELNALRRIKHPHYIRLISAYTDERYIGMVMQPVADYNLGEFLDNFKVENKHEIGLLMSFFGCLATALDNLHYRWNMRHRDIKPQNILVHEKVILLTDFGIALDWSEKRYTTTKEEQMRSPRYAAPEIDAGQPRNSSADIWSLGCVFLEMITVLKGKERSFVTSLLAKYGKGGSDWFCRSPEGIFEVIKGLKEKPAKCGNAPLEWVEDMLKNDMGKRPTSSKIRQRILDSGRRCGYTFWQDCCAGHDTYGESDADDDGYSDTSATQGVTSNSFVRIELPNDNDVASIHELLNAGFDKHGVDLTGKKRLGLHWAIKERKSDIVSLLLRNKTVIKGSEKEDEFTVLHMAAKFGDVDILKQFLERNPDINAASEVGWTPLHSAVQNGRVDAVKLLLEHGADPKSRVGIGWTALHSAAERGFKNIAEVLLQYGAEVSVRNNNGVTPLYKAAYSGHASVLRFLIQRGADPNERDTDVRSPLHAAANGGHVEAAKALLEAEADVDSKDKDGATPLHWAAAQGYMDTVNLLLDHGAGIDVQNDREATAIYLAIHSHHESTIKLLIKRGADVNIGNFHGWFPLVSAADNGDLKLVEILIQDPKVDLEKMSGDGRTALHMAAVNDHTNVAVLLLDKGANIHARDRNEWTPLHWAASRGHVNAVKLLLDRDADVTLVDDEGQTALQRAEQRGHSKVAETLEKALGE